MKFFVMIANGVKLVKKWSVIALVFVLSFSAAFPVLGNDAAENAAHSEGLIEEWDNALKPYGFERVPASSVSAELRASASSWPKTLKKILAQLESRHSTAVEQDSGPRLYSSNRTYECKRKVGGLGNGWFKHFVDGVIGRRHGKQIFSSVSNDRWAHTGLTLGTKVSNVSVKSSITSDRRKLTMKSSWVVSAGIPTPWGEYYFHSEAVSNSCTKSP